MRHLGEIEDVAYCAVFLPPSRRAISRARSCSPTGLGDAVRAADGMEHGTIRPMKPPSTQPGRLVIPKEIRREQAFGPVSLSKSGGRGADRNRPAPLPVSCPSWRLLVAEPHPIQAPPPRHRGERRVGRCAAKPTLSDAGVLPMIRVASLRRSVGAREPRAGSEGNRSTCLARPRSCWSLARP